MNGRLALHDSTPEDRAKGQGEDVDVFQRLQSFTAEEWRAGLKVYVYRIWPVIDRREDSHFLAKVAEPFDEDYLLRHFGSGKYYLRLNDQRGQTIGGKTVSLHNPSYPPKVSPDEVVQTDPRNEMYFRVWTPPATPAPTAQDAAAVQELSKLASKVLEHREAKSSPSEQESLNATLVKWALDQAAKEKDGNDPVRLVNVLQEMKKLLPQQQTDGLDQVDRILSIVEKLNPPRPSAEPQDPLTYVERVLSLADKLRPAQAGAAEGPLASIASITHEAVELLKNPLSMVTQLWVASKMRESNAPANAPAAAPVASQLSRVPAEPPMGSPTHPPIPQAAPPPSPAPSAQPQNAPADLRQQHLIALANSITPVMLRWLLEDAPGRQLGTNFAAWVCDGYGNEDLKVLQAVGGAGIIEIYRNSPVWAILAPMEVKFHDFVSGFVDWQPSDDDDEPDEDFEFPQSEG